MPYMDADGLVECGHGDESYCTECGGCADCSNCYCDEYEDEGDPTEYEGVDYLNNWA